MSGEATLHAWDGVPFEALRGGMRRRFVHADRLMIAEVRFSAGDDVPRHAHENEQITWVISGALRFWFGDDDGQELVVRPGELVSIPSNLAHRARAEADTVSYDLFTPPRADWIAGSDAYLRG